MRANDRQSKYTCEHEINNAFEHTSTLAFKPLSTHISYHSITLGLKHNHQSMWVSKYPTTWTFLVSKHIDISSIKCIHLWLKNKSYEGVTLNLYVAFKNERIQAFDHDSKQSCDH